MIHFLEKLMSCQSHSTVPVCILQRSAKVSRRSNRTLVEPLPNHHCGYFCNGRFYVQLSIQHPCICTHKTSTERQLLTTQVLLGQCSSKNSRCPCRGNQTVCGWLLFWRGTFTSRRRQCLYTPHRHLPLYPHVVRVRPSLPEGKIHLIKWLAWRA